MRGGEIPNNDFCWLKPRRPIINYRFCFIVSTITYKYETPWSRSELDRIYIVLAEGVLVRQVAWLWLWIIADMSAAVHRCSFQSDLSSLRCLMPLLRGIFVIQSHGFVTIIHLKLWFQEVKKQKSRWAKNKKYANSLIIPKNTKKNPKKQKKTESDRNQTVRSHSLPHSLPWPHCGLKEMWTLHIW